MKLTELFNNIVEQKIKEAITISDLKNLGTNLKQGITNLGNKPMNVDFSGNLGKGQVAQSKMDALAREVGFEIPQALKTGNIKKALGPFTDLSDTSDLASFLKVSNIDMNKIRAMKSCFGRDWSDKNQLIQIIVNPYEPSYAHMYYIILIKFYIKYVLSIKHVFVTDC